MGVVMGVVEFPKREFGKAKVVNPLTAKFLQQF